MNTLTFLYNNKLRIVKPIAVRRGRFGSALLLAETRTGKIKAFNMAAITPLTVQQQAILDGETAINS